jgi:hypothetical protein
MRSMGDTAGRPRVTAMRWGRGWFVALAAALAASTVARADPAPDDPMTKIPPSHAADQPQGGSNSGSQSSEPDISASPESPSSTSSDTVADMPAASAEQSPPPTTPDATPPSETQHAPPSGQPDRPASPPPDGATPS